MTTSIPDQTTHTDHAHARRIADHLVDAPHGVLSVVDLAAIPCPWADVLVQLSDLSAARRTPVMWVDLGGHDDTRVWHRPQEVSDYLVLFVDHDRDFHPVWEDERLAPELHVFGTPSITETAKEVADTEPEEGPPLLVVLDNPAEARPYAAITERLRATQALPDRDAAEAAVHAWRARDLVVYAETRPDAPTVVAAHPDDPGREQLLREAVRLPLGH